MTDVSRIQAFARCRSCGHPIGLTRQDWTHVSTRGTSRGCRSASFDRGGTWDETFDRREAAQPVAGSEVQESEISDETLVTALVHVGEPFREPLSSLRGGDTLATLKLGQLRTGAAAGVVVATWRASMELLHYRICNAEMACMNIAATEAVVPCVSMSGIDWRRATRVLLDPLRQARPGVRALDVLVDDWPAFADDVDEGIGRQAESWTGPTGVFQAFGWSLMVCRGWWGTPGYEAQVDDFVARACPVTWAGSPGELAVALKARPLSVPLDVWEEIVAGNGMGWVR